MRVLVKKEILGTRGACRGGDTSRPMPGGSFLHSLWRPLRSPQGHPLLGNKTSPSVWAPRPPPRTAASGVAWAPRPSRAPQPRPGCPVSPALSSGQQPWGSPGVFLPPQVRRAANAQGFTFRPRSPYTSRSTPPSPPVWTSGGLPDPPLSAPPTLGPSTPQP